jgi:hypothetical protein
MPADDHTVVFTLRPARYVPIIFYGGSLAVFAYLLLLSEKSAGVWILGGGGAVVTAVGLAHFAFSYRIEFTRTALHQHRFFGLGDRNIPLASITGVAVRVRRNFYGGAVPRICIVWHGDAICLTSSMYFERDLRRALALLRDADVAVPPEVLHRFKVPAS